MPDIFPDDHDCLVQSVIEQTEQVGAQTLKRVRICRVCSRLWSTIETCKGRSTNSRHVQVKIDRIMDITCEIFDVTREDMLSRRQPKKLARARQVAMYLCREFGYSYTKIGSFFHRHYSTVLHDCRRITEDLETDEHLDRYVTIALFNLNNEERQQLA